MNNKNLLTIYNNSDDNKSILIVPYTSIMHIVCQDNKVYVYTQNNIIEVETIADKDANASTIDTLSRIVGCVYIWSKQNN